MIKDLKVFVGAQCFINKILRLQSNRKLRIALLIKHGETYKYILIFNRFIRLAKLASNISFLTCDLYMNMLY